MPIQKPRLISSEIAYENSRFRIRHDKLIWADGTPGDFYVSESTPSCLVVAEQDGRLLIVEQYRYQMDDVTLEFPAGHFDGSEKPEQAGARELLEETGYEAARIERLGWYQTIGRVKTYVLVAHDLIKKCEPKLDAGETGMTHRWIPVEEWRELVRKNSVVMYSTLAAWALYQQRRTGNT